MTSSEPPGPFVPGPGLQRAGAAHGALAGLRFAAEGLYDVAGETTRGGNADWAVDARPALACRMGNDRLLLRLASRMAADLGLPGYAGRSRSAAP